MSRSTIVDRLVAKRPLEDPPQAADVSSRFSLLERASRPSSSCRRARSSRGRPRCRCERDRARCPVASLNSATIAREISRFRLRVVDPDPRWSPRLGAPRRVFRRPLTRCFLAYIVGYVLRVPKATTQAQPPSTASGSISSSVDSELARLIGTAEGRSTDRPLWAAAIKLHRGPWQPERREPPGAHLGFLVLDGLIGRRVVVPGSRAQPRAARARGPLQPLAGGRRLLLAGARGR